MQIFDAFAHLFGTKGWKEHFWLTLGKTIYHPAGIGDPLSYTGTVCHELVHVNQQSRTWLWWWITRYLCSWKYRWQMERDAYLEEIRLGRSIESIAVSMRIAYRIPLEFDVICKWFEDNK